MVHLLHRLYGVDAPVISYNRTQQLAAAGARPGFFRWAQDGRAQGRQRGGGFMPRGSNSLLTSWGAVFENTYFMFFFRFQKDMTFYVFWK